MTGPDPWCHSKSLLALVTHIWCSLGARPALTVRCQLMVWSVRSADTRHKPHADVMFVTHRSQECQNMELLRVSKSYWITIFWKDYIVVGPLLSDYAHKPTKWYQFESGFEILEAWEKMSCYYEYLMFSFNFPVSSAVLCLLCYSRGSRQGWPLARPGELRIRDRCEDHLISRDTQSAAEWWPSK